MLQLKPTQDGLLIWQGVAEQRLGFNRVHVQRVGQPIENHRPCGQGNHVFDDGGAEASGTFMDGKNSMARFEECSAFCHAGGEIGGRGKLTMGKQGRKAFDAIRGRFHVPFLEDVQQIRVRIGAVCKRRFSRPERQPQGNPRVGWRGQ